MEIEIVGGVALLDANILLPVSIVDFVLTASTYGLVRPVVSPGVLAETRRNMRDKLAISEAKIDYRLDRMARFLPGSGDEPGPLIDQRAIEVVNPKDQHVLAAALHHDADFILSNDQRFVAEVNLWRTLSHDTTYRLWGALTADALAIHLVEHEPGLVTKTIKDMANRTRNPPMTATRILTTLSKHMPSLARLAKID